jgi:MFS family permease
MAIMLQALRIRDFRLLWAGGLISSLGSWLLTLAIPTHIFLVTGSLRATGLTVAAEYLPLLVLGPVAGVFADRWDRRRLLIGTNLFCAGAVAVMLLGTAPGRYWVLYAALVAENAGVVLNTPAWQARTPAIVGTGSMLSSANALNSVSSGTVRLIGGPLGGVLLAVWGARWLIGIDAASYLLSAAAMFMTSAPGRDPRDRDPRGREAEDRERTTAESARCSSPARRRRPWAAPRSARSWPRRPASPSPPRSPAWSPWPRPHSPGSASRKPPSRSVMAPLLWHYRLVASNDLDRLARTAYEAHRGAQSDSLPSWEDTSDQEKKAWRAAVSAVTGSGESTLTEAPAAHSIVVQAGDQVRTFHTEFTAGRQGSLVVNDEHASSHHALFQLAHGYWFVQDLGSTNGTWLNNRRMYAAQRLKKGDKIKIGRTIVVVVSAT